MKSWNKLSRQLQRMTNDELEALLNADDVFVLDALLTHSQTSSSSKFRQKDPVKKLERERDELRKQVLSLAEENYAREPEFVRDRLRLREKSEELTGMVKQIQTKYMEPTLVKINHIQKELTQDTMKLEEESEAMALKFLVSGCQADPTSEESYDEFICNYIRLRKATSKKRILADRLAKERDQLMGNIIYKTKLLAGEKSSPSSSRSSSSSSPPSLPSSSSSSPIKTKTVQFLD